MADPSSAWNEVGSQFSGLGQKLRYHFEQTRSAAEAADSSEATAEDATSDAGNESQRANERVNEALRKLGAAIENVVEAVGGAVKDPAVKQDVKNVGGALSEALSQSFATIGDDLRRAFRQGGGNDAPSTPTDADAPGGHADAPPATDAQDQTETSPPGV